MAPQRLVIPGIPEDDQNDIDELWQQLRNKQRRNILRASYYDGKNATKQLGMSMPPAFARVATVLGWPAKAVDTLNSRCHLEGFVAADFDVEGAGVGEIWDANKIGLEAPQAGLSSLIHSVAWLITTRGDENEGEPKALITTRDALTGTGLWDSRRRELSAFLSLIDSDDDGYPSDIAVYFPDRLLVATRDGWKWEWEIRSHDLGGVPVEPLVHKPRIGRPFGSSRISRAVMSMTDLAMRTVLRSEVSAELYSIPQRVLLGASESAFTNPDGTAKAAWQVVFGRVWALERDDEGLLPEIHQMQQASQQPHMDQLRSLAQLFAGETSIPVSSLGISTEANPASAEAYYASREDLIALAEGTTDGWKPAWNRTMQRALSIVNDTPIDAYSGLRARFRSPTLTSRAASADATVKMIQAFPWMAESDTALEMYGFDPDTLERLLTDKRRSQSRSTVAGLAAAVGAPPTEDAAAIKAKADAMGVLIRAGADPRDAAERVGFIGLEFTGAVPTSLRLPNSDANTLEKA